jgi:hypothetical protein
MGSLFCHYVEDERFELRRALEAHVGALVEVGRYDPVDP